MNNVEIKRITRGLKTRFRQSSVRALEDCFCAERPLIVFDCADLHQMDQSTVLLLLCSLERAILLNGDVKLAALPGQARKVLHLNGADNLFEMFETTAEAAGSFRNVSSHLTPIMFATEDHKVRGVRPGVQGIQRYSCTESESR